MQLPSATKVISLALLLAAATGVTNADYSSSSDDYDLSLARRAAFEDFLDEPLYTRSAFAEPEAEDDFLDDLLYARSAFAEADPEEDPDSILSLFSRDELESYLARRADKFGNTNPRPRPPPSAYPMAKDQHKANLLGNLVAG